MAPSSTENQGVSFVAVSRAPLLFTEEERRSGTGFNFGTARRADMNARDMELHGLSGDDFDDWPRRNDEYEEAIHAG